MNEFFPIRIYHDYVMASYLVDKQFVTEEVFLHEIIRGIKAIAKNGYLISINTQRRYYKNRNPDIMDKIKSWVICNILKVKRDEDDCVVGFNIDDKGRAALQHIINQCSSALGCHICKIDAILKKAWKT